MYLIRYQTDEGAVNSREMSSWDEAMSCWEALMADRKVRIVPDPRTGLYISMPVELKRDSMPASWNLMVA
jgi:hypothetical protein